MILRRAALLSSIFLLAGCAGPLKQLKELNPSANDFPSALASEYLAYGESEAEQGRAAFAEHYAAKGLKALKNEDVLPDEPDKNLSVNDQDKLATARAHLLALLTDDIKHVAPQKLARAQLLFDCWQHQLGLHISQEMAPCAEEFSATMSELQEVADSFIYGKENTYVIAFNAHETTLDEEDVAVIKAVAEKAIAAGQYDVQLDAYIGIHSWQRRLTDKRIAAVKKALIDNGVPASVIHVKKHGNPKAVILHGDNIKAPDAKKIDITIKMRNVH